MPVSECVTSPAVGGHEMRLSLTAFVGLLAGWVLVPAAPSGATPAPDKCLGEIATIVGTSGDDDLNGTEGRDVVSLGSGDDVFDGLGGDDLVYLHRNGQDRCRSG